MPATWTGAPSSRVVQGYTAATLLLAGGLAAASHGLYSCYDLIGRRQTGHALRARQVLATAFVSYAFNLNLGALVGRRGPALAPLFASGPGGGDHHAGAGAEPGHQLAGLPGAGRCDVLGLPAGATPGLAARQRRPAPCRRADADTGRRLCADVLHDTAARLAPARPRADAARWGVGPAAIGAVVYQLDAHGRGRRRPARRSGRIRRPCSACC